MAYTSFSWSTVRGDVDRGERVRRADRPVAAGGEACPRPVEAAKGILPARPLRPEEGQRQLDHLVVELGP